MREYIMRDDSKALPTRMETIVRCKDCRRWNGIENALWERVCERSGKFCQSNGFCAWGEEKKDEG